MRSATLAYSQRKRFLPAWLISIFLIMIFLIALLSAMALPARSAHAQTMQAQRSEQVTVARNWKDFNRGWNAGYRDTVTACLYGKHQQLRSAAVQRSHRSDYDKGYLAGVDAAMKFARVCQAKGNGGGGGGHPHNK